MYSPGSDVAFDKALEVLLAFMRSECFEDVVREGDDDDSSSEDLSPEEIEYLDNLEPMSSNTLAKYSDEPDENYPWEFQKSKHFVDTASDEGDKEIIDDRSNQQLWQRLKNDVEQDPSLEGAAPAQLQAFFKQWIYARNANRFGSSRYRFFIIMDSEVISKLVRISLPLPKYLDIDRLDHSVKVFDAEFNPKHSQLRNPKLWNPRLVKRLSKDEGWFWATGDSLASLFFMCRTDEFQSVRSWDEYDRPSFRENVICCSMMM